MICQSIKENQLRSLPDQTLWTFQLISRLINHCLLLNLLFCPNISRIPLMPHPLGTLTLNKTATIILDLQNMKRTGITTEEIDNMKDMENTRTKLDPWDLSSWKIHMRTVISMITGTIRRSHTRNLTKLSMLFSKVSYGLLELRS